MKIRLAEGHEFNEKAVRELQQFLDVEMTGDEILDVLVNKFFDPIVPYYIKDGVLYVAHTQAF